MSFDICRFILEINDFIYKWTFILNRLCGVNSPTTTLWTGLFPTAGCLVIFIITMFFIEIPVFNAVSVDPDQPSR